MPPFRKWSRGLVIAMAFVALGGLLSACSSPTSAFAPSASGCFATLPSASSTAGQSAVLLGVRYLSETTINADLRRRGEVPLPQAGFSSAVRLCLVGYKGPFAARRLVAPWPRGRDRALFALVVFLPNRRRVFHTVLVDRLPLRLSRI